MSVGMKIPYVNVAGQHALLRDELLAAVGRVLDHGQFILGAEVAEFEDRFAALCKARYAVGVNSGTDALILALRALGVGPGDEVITAPNSFVATAGCIALVGARPVFVDVRDDYNIDPDQIVRALTPRTRAILPVHLTGRPADMEPICEIARARGAAVIEDCAQAVCAEYRGRRVGSFGALGCFSLHPLKTLNACGDGGVVTTDDPGLHERLTILRNIGLQTRDNCVQWGYNSRLDTLQAAILLQKMKYVEEWTERRRGIARLYAQRLADVPEVQTPSERPFERAVYHTFVIQAERRDALQRYLSDQGVGTRIHYPVPIHLQPVAAGLEYGPASFPVAERQAEQILSLPVYPELTASEVGYVVDSIRSFYRR